MVHKPTVWMLSTGTSLELWNEAASTKTSIAVGSEEWFSWLESQEIHSFVFKVGQHYPEISDFSARRETRDRGGNYWTAYKRIDGKLRKSYLGKSEELTSQRLQEVGQKLFNPISHAEVTQQKLGNISLTELDAIADEILNDGIVTRGGKDKGAVRRTVEAFISRLYDYAS